MSLQQFCVRWNNHLKIFQSALPKYFQSQKFLDCTLVVEGQHFISCHRMVLDACSEYFANFLKNKIFDDKNIVICLPKEIKLWQIQAILQFMYHGEVCISQEGLPSLVKCAEILQVKGLCRSDRGTEVLENSQGSQTPNQPKQEIQNKLLQDNSQDSINNASQNGQNINSNGMNAITIDENDSDMECNGQLIKREININDVMDDGDDDNDTNYSNQNPGFSQFEKKDDDYFSKPDDQEQTDNDIFEVLDDPQTESQSLKQQQKNFGLIRVKNNLFDNFQGDAKALNDSGIIDFEDLGDVSDDVIMIKNQEEEEASNNKNSIVFNRNSMDIYLKHSNDGNGGTASQTTSAAGNSPTSNQFENIVCAPNLLQYMSDGDNNEEKTNLENMDGDGEVTAYYMPSKLQTQVEPENLYEFMRQKFAASEETSFIPVNSNNSQNKKSHFVIASVSSLNQLNANKKSKMEQENEAKMFQNLQKLCGDDKASIGGLYLRNPRGNQVRQYDVNALYSALQDVKNGHSIYRAAQTYSVPRKTLRNWMKRLHIKSAYPMPRQLQAAAERKKIMQQQTSTPSPSINLTIREESTSNIVEELTSIPNISIP